MQSINWNLGVSYFKITFFLLLHRIEKPILYACENTQCRLRLSRTHRQCIRTQLVKSITCLFRHCSLRMCTENPTSTIHHNIFLESHESYILPSASFSSMSLKPLILIYLVLEEFINVLWFILLKFLWLFELQVFPILDGKVYMLEHNIYAFFIWAIKW